MGRERARVCMGFGIQLQTDPGPPNTCCATAQLLLLWQWGFLCHPQQWNARLKVRRGDIPGEGTPNSMERGILTKNKSCKMWHQRGSQCPEGHPGDPGLPRMCLPLPGCVWNAPNEVCLPPVSLAHESHPAQPFQASPIFPSQHQCCQWGWESLIPKSGGFRRILSCLVWCTTAKSLMGKAEIWPGIDWKRGLWGCGKHMWIL